MRHLILSSLLIAGCTGKEPATTTDDTASETVDSATPEDTSAPTDTAPDTDSTSVDLAELEDLTVRAFDATGSTGDFTQVAPDFTWNLMDGGTWNLQENWSGYDTYVAVNLYDESFPVNMTNTSKAIEWLETSPVNVHWFFLVYSDDEGTISSVLETTKATVEEALDALDADLAAHWTSRVHYVTDGAFSADWIGELNQANYVEYDDGGSFAQFGAAIDRFQVVRETGYYCDPYDGWSTCSPNFMSFEPQYFNFESDRQDQMDSEGDVTVLRAFDREPVSDSGWAGVRSYAEVEFPDADTMATFDTMSFDLTLECAESPELVYCPPWDYLVHAYLCDVDDPGTEEDESENCSTEIGRWITTYWRAGRWVHDVTPYLALLQEGGTRRISFYTQQYYDVTLDVRLSNQDVGVRPIAMEPLFTGGTFNERYNWGMHHTVSDDTWLGWIDASEPLTWNIGQRDDEAGWIVAENGSDQPISRGLWSRFDWTLSDDTLHLCRTSSTADDEEEALAVPAADSADLETGCDGGAWRTLVAAEGTTPDGVNGDWIETWHEDKAPVTFTPPATATQVGLTALISGHGFGNTREACAEFCDHRHRFTVNDGASYTRAYDNISTRWGCAEQIHEGVVPNQAGTWVYGRAGWCPGLEVRPWSIDITDDVTLGEENTLGYLGLFEGEVNYVPRYNGGYSSTDARIDLRSYLVYYE